MKTLFKTEQSAARSTAQWEPLTRGNDNREFLIWRNPSNAVQKCSPYAFPKGDLRNQFIYELKMERINQKPWAFPGQFVKGRGLVVVSRGARASSPAASSWEPGCNVICIGDFEAAGYPLD